SFPRSRLRLFRRALGEVVVGRAGPRPRRPRQRIARLELDDDAAIIAHADDVGGGSGGEHRMLAGELRDDALDRGARAKLLAAADALRRLFLLEHDDAPRRLAEAHARLEGDDLLGAGRAAEAALHAGCLLEAEQRLLGIVAEGAGRTGA